MAIDVQALTAKRADYVQGLSNVQAQAQAARQQLEQLVRQVAVQEGAIAAIDELLGMAQGDGREPDAGENEAPLTLAG